QTRNGQESVRVRRGIEIADNIFCNGVLQFRFDGSILISYRLQKLHGTFFQSPHIIIPSEGILQPQGSGLMPAPSPNYLKPPVERIQFNNGNIDPGAIEVAITVAPYTFV